MLVGRSDESLHINRCTRGLSSEAESKITNMLKRADHKHRQASQILEGAKSSQTPADIVKAAKLFREALQASSFCVKDN